MSDAIAQDTYIAAANASNRYMIRFLDGPDGFCMPRARWDAIIAGSTGGNHIVVPDENPEPLPPQAAGRFMGLPVVIWEHAPAAAFGYDEVGQICVEPLDLVLPVVPEGDEP